MSLLVELRLLPGLDQCRLLTSLTSWVSMRPSQMGLEQLTVLILNHHCHHHVDVIESTSSSLLSSSTSSPSSSTSPSISSSLWSPSPGKVSAGIPAMIFGASSVAAGLAAMVIRMMMMMMIVRSRMIMMIMMMKRMVIASRILNLTQKKVLHSP